MELFVAKLTGENGQQGFLVGGQEMVLQAAGKGGLLHRHFYVAGPHDEVPQGIDDHSLPRPLVQEPQFASPGHNVLQDRLIANLLQPSWTRQVVFNSSRQVKVKTFPVKSTIIAGYMVALADPACSGQHLELC